TASSPRAEKSFKISQPKSTSLAYGRRRCNSHRLSWPHCPKPLRDWRKEWSLPPGRYRLGGSIADCANLSTGSVVRPNRTTAGSTHARDRNCSTASIGGPTVDAKDRPESQLPSAMNKLLHPRKYFVGKIRPGDRMSERPTLRLAISDPTVCARDPNEPGPTSYDPHRQLRPPQPRVVGRKARPACSCYTYDSYCREPFFRPPPGRYGGTVVSSSALPTARTRYRSTKIRIPVPPTVVTVAPTSRKVTLRLNSINIPVRPRKGRRSMKVAFMSGSPRFRDRDFFPIGGLGSRTTSSRPAGARVRGTSKQSHDDSRTPAATGSAVAAGLSRVLQPDEPDVRDGVRAGDGLGDVEEFLLAHGISKVMPRHLPAGTQRGIPTRFFNVPTLSQVP
uniref:Uncharacterized protein n=1 Tax=Anopheles farauti TaxID=69004 RepID=A0A182Q732_9DIPT